MNIEFENYSDFDEWCRGNGYDPEKLLDVCTEPHKRDIVQGFYLENSIDGSFACVSVLVSDQWGWTDICVTEGYEQKTIVTKKNVYTVKK